MFSQGRAKTVHSLAVRFCFQLTLTTYDVAVPEPGVRNQGKTWWRLWGPHRREGYGQALAQTHGHRLASGYGPSALVPGEGRLRVWLQRALDAQAQLAGKVGDSEQGRKAGCLEVGADEAPRDPGTWDLRQGQGRWDPA